MTSQGHRTPRRTHSVHSRLEMQSKSPAVTDFSDLLAAAADSVWRPPRSVAARKGRHGARHARMPKYSPNASSCCSAVQDIPSRSSLRTARNSHRRQCLGKSCVLQFHSAILGGAQAAWARTCGCSRSKCPCTLRLTTQTTRQTAPFTPRIVDPNFANPPFTDTSCLHTLA